MSSKLLVASVSLAQYVSAEVHYGYSGDPNQVGYARDRFEFISLSLSCHININFISGQGSELGWHHIAGIPQWVTAWAFVALFIGIVSVFIECCKKDFNL